MIARNLALAGLIAFGLTLGGCSDPSTFSLPMTKKLRLADLTPERQELLRATIEAPGLLAETELKFDDTFTSVSGSFVVKVEQETTTPVAVRVWGRLSAQHEEVLLGRAEVDARFAPRESTAITFADKDWVVSGRAIFDLNGNEASNADDLAAGFDPAPPVRVLDVAPSGVQFPAGILPGEDTRQVVVIENVSGLPQLVAPRLVGGQGVKVARIDATGAPGKGERDLTPFVVEPFAEALLAVSFGPSNAFLVRGGLVLDTEHVESGVRASHEVTIIGNPDGDPQPVPPGYDPGTLAGDRIGFDGAVVAYPAELLFGAQPLSPGTVLADGGAVERLAIASNTVSGVPASAVFLVQVPARHRLSATLSSLADDADLAVFVLDGDELSTADGAAQVSSHPGVAPESVELRNESSTDAIRAVLVVGRRDLRESADDPKTTAAFSLLAALAAGPEIETVEPDVGLFGGGTDVTITGFGFVPGATVRFGSHVADPSRTTVEQDGAVVRTVSPAGSAADIGAELAVVVLNPDGQAGTLPAPAFSFLPPNPVVTSVDPPTASTLGGTQIVIVGAFFDDGRDGDVPEDLSDASTVLIAGTPAVDVVVESSTRIVCTAPPGTVGFTSLVVQNTAADGTTLASPDVGFLYVAPTGDAPSITSVQPASGPVSGNTPLVIEGENFASEATVRIGGTTALSVQVNAAGTRIDCRTPLAFSAADVDVVVINLDGQTTDPPGAFSYVFLPPTVDDVSPDFASQLGGTRLFVHGSDFETGATATLTQDALSFPAQLERVSSALVIVTVPAGLQAGVAQLRVTSEIGQASNPTDVTILAPAATPPRILSVNPASVRVDALTSVTLTGTDFAPGILLFVDEVETQLLGTPTATSLSFNPPVRAEGVAILRVVNPDGQNDADALVYLSPLNPVLDNVFPDAVGAFVPGDVLTFTGTNLVAGLGAGSVKLVSDTPDPDDADGYAFTLLSSSATQLRVLVREPLPDDPAFHLEVDFPGFADTVLSPPFSAIAPAVISAQTVQGQPVDGGSFAVLLQGAALNPSQIDAIRFSPTVGPAIDLVPTVSTTGFVRVDVAGELAQGSYSVAIVYAFTDHEDQARTHIAPAPGAFVVAGACGNTVIEPGEECDPDGPTLGGLTCADVGFFGGTLGCTNSCTLDVSDCTLCGNDNIDDPLLEECDGSDLGGVVCQDGDVDFTGGAVACTADCRLSFVGCTECGNGLVEESEQCDGSNLDGATCTTLGLGFDSGPLACNASCQFDTATCDSCGDNRCGATEDFDCNPTFQDCTLCPADCASTCGNGVCDAAEGCNTCPRDCAAQCNPPFTITQVQGAGQSQRFASDLAQPFVVHVEDNLGAPLRGLQITFTAPAGAHLSPTTAITDPLGNASTLATLPRAPGVLQFTASGSGPDNTTLAGAPLSLSATGLDVAPLVVATLLNQSSVGRTDLLDAGGNPLPRAATKTQVQLAGASGLAVGSGGVFFLSDTANHRVLRIDENGVATHVAGSVTGSAGNAAEGVLARTAPLNSPRGLAVDAAGNLFIADSTNNRVKRIDAVTGLLTTVVGGGAVTTENILATGAQLSTPVAVAVAANGELYVQQTGGTQHIRRVATNGLINTVVANGQCTTANGVRAASMDTSQLTFDRQGRLLFIANVSNGGGCPVPPNTEHVLRLEPDGTLSSVAGGATSVAIGPARGAVVTDPTGLAVDVAGNIYLSERNGASARRIRRISPLGVISTVVGTGGTGNSGDGGPALNAALNLPVHIGITPTNDLLIADEGNHNVRVVRAIGELVTPTIEVTLLGDGQSAPVNQALAAPLGVRLEDSNGNPIGGVSLTVVAASGAAAEPNVITTDASGNATFVGFVGLAPGSYSFVLGGNGPDGLPLPGSPFVVDALAVPYPTGTVFALVNQTSTAGNAGVPGAASRARMAQDAGFGGVAVDPDDGTLYVADPSNHRVLRVRPSGLTQVVAGTGVSGRGTSGPANTVALSFPRGLALDADKNLYIADSNNDYVRVLLGADQDCANGCQLNVFAGNLLNDANPADGVVATGANLDNPGSLALGPDGDLFIVDESHLRIRRVDIVTPGVPGTISTTAASAQCSTAGGVRPSTFPDSGLAFDQGGRLYFGATVSNSGGCPLPDPNGQYLLRMETNGTFTAIAGGNIERTSGAAFPTDLDTVSGLAVDAGGNLFVAEQSGHRIRRIDLLGRMTVVMGDGIAGLSGDGTVTSSGRISNPTGLAFTPTGDLIWFDGGNRTVRTKLGVGQPDSPTARLEIDSGNNQSVTLGQSIALPLRVRVLEDGTDAPVPGVPVTFSTGNAGDAVALTASNTDANGAASTGLRIGRTVGVNHAVSATAATWLESIPLTGSPQVFAVTGVRPTALSSVAVFNAFGVAGALPPNGSGLTIPAVSGNGNFTDAGLALAADGTLFVADTNNHRILEISPEGAVSVFAGTGVAGFVDNVDRFTARFSAPKGVAVDPAGNVYVLDFNNDRIRMIDVFGNVSTFAGGNTDTPGHGDGNDPAAVNFSSAIALARGPDGALYVADDGHNNVRRIVISPFAITTPVISQTCTTAQPVARPGDILSTGLAFDTSGRLLLAATISNGGGCPANLSNVEAIMRGDQLPGAGTITSWTLIAGSSTVANTGDGFSGNAARLSGVHGIVVDVADDDIYFIESGGSHRLRRIPGGSPSGAISTVLGQFNTQGFSALTLPGAGLMTFPERLIRDTNGDLYFTEQGSDAVRLFVP